MSGVSEPSIAAVARMFGLNWSTRVPTKVFCPFTKHKRTDKTFRIFNAKSSGDELWLCWSCNEPENRGDAVALYARLAGMERKDAWKRLRELGYIEGNDRGYRARQDARRPERRPDAPRPPPVEGSRPEQILPLDQRRLAAWQGRDTGALAKLAGKRRIPLATLQGRVVEVASDAVGFVYVDPRTEVPCRVKVRSLDHKAFWIEPRGTPDKPGRALAPLYLASELVLLPLQGLRTEAAIIVEGEIDALSLKAVGLPNVVSLPDGAKSASTVDIGPIMRKRLWLSATDADEEGDKAHATLCERAKAAPGVEVIRVRWKRWFDEDDLITYKDANEALCAGMTAEDFGSSVDDALAVRFGGAVQWRAA